MNEESDYVEDNVQTEDVTENIIIIQEEQEFEAQKVSPVQEIITDNNNNQYEKFDEEKPIIVYPEGTPGQPDYNPDPPAPVFPSPEQQPSPSLPYAPRRPPPPPPQFNRRPIRPQNNNYRRPLVSFFFFFQITQIYIPNSFFFSQTDFGL